MPGEAFTLLQHRILFLAESIACETANHLIAQLLLLDADDSERPIDLYINSPDGSVTDGIAIIDAMQCIRAPVSTICIGQAASMAAWILAAGAPGQRQAAPNAEVMIHQVAAGFAGQTADIQVFAQRTLRIQERLVGMLAQWTRQPEERIRRDMASDFFMTADDALSYGIIDEVIQPVPKGSSNRKPSNTR